MLRPSEFRELVSGRRRGLFASTLRMVLRAVEWPYTAVVRQRNRYYDTATAAVHRVDVPIVSVGNLTLGGTGKTPMVRWIAEWFCRHQARVAIVSRGYRRRLDSKNEETLSKNEETLSKNDEALELALSLPDVPHVQNPDRVAAAQEAIERFDSRVIVLDDAFQHRRLGRDLDIVLLDAVEPFGHDHVFPRGTLREPVEGLGRADVVILSRADMLGADQRESIRRRVRRHAPDAIWAEVVHAPETMLLPNGQEEPIESLQGKPVAAFCGIGNPAGFRHTLDACGCRVVEFREFADHHRYTPRDVESLVRWAARLDVAALLCTQKDRVKLDPEQFGSCPLGALTIGIQFLAGRKLLEKRLAAIPLS